MSTDVDMTARLHALAVDRRGAQAGRNGEVTDSRILRNAGSRRNGVLCHRGWFMSGLKKGAGPLALPARLAGSVAVVALMPWLAAAPAMAQNAQTAQAA